ncbi:MAG: hypothetical protein IJ341_02625 [Bacteroidales bacterium]|nr:hypothetical protein [Bacteroidales bacterium]
MKSKYETLVCVVDYVIAHSKDVISAANTLLDMGFTPCQLVREFKFKEADVRATNQFKENAWKTDDGAFGLNENEYPYLLGHFSRFDAELISWFKLTSDEIMQLRKTGIYERIKLLYDEDKEEALTDVMNDIFDKENDSIFAQIKNIRIENEYQRLTVIEVDDLKENDTVFVRIGDEMYESKVIRPLFLNTDSDEQEWEVETTNGFSDVDSLYKLKEGNT